ncbi:MAG: riboflavin synthase [Alphaproteobacteria bacterium]|nr:riboflavin synthase [Alphaproteobacteria bacterium]
MFTGIITDIGRVRSVEQRGDTRFIIGTAFDMATVDIGASIACGGACLTVVEKTRDSFTVDVSAETLSKTTLGQWSEGTPVNLERSLTLGSELGGHLVTGHVDGLATLTAAERDGDSHRLSVEAPEGLEGFVATKGSVCLDGVSLTVNAVAGRRFELNLIPHTWDHTTFRDRSVGDKLNMEVDLLARYVARLAETGTVPVSSLISRPIGS